MKALLFLAILAAGGGAAYEFYIQQQAQADFLQKRTDDIHQIAQLKQQNTQMEQDNAQSMGHLGGR
jgi:hypothetical protein